MVKWSYSSTYFFKRYWIVVTYHLHTLTAAPTVPSGYDAAQLHHCCDEEKSLGDTKMHLARQHFRTWNEIIWLRLRMSGGLLLTRLLAVEFCERRIVS
jgi:hypothetical protein